MTKTRAISIGLCLAALLGFAAGCGEKIAIPEAVGDFGLITYDRNASLVPDFELREIKFSAAGLHLLGPDRIETRDISLAVTDSLVGLVDARTICYYPAQLLLLVWEEEPRRLSWYDVLTLDQVGSQVIPELTGIVAIEVNDAGVDQAPWARTFLYLSAPDAGLIHRYAFDPVLGAESFGILSRSGGAAARFVHVAGGLTTDWENRLLVCDRDSVRNWVIRFDSTPDTTDTAANPDDEDPRRGLVVVFADSSDCDPKPPGDFVLGSALECEDPPGSWVGKPSAAEGEFDRPGFVAIDGQGRIFVTDTGNDRVQVFSWEGVFELQFGSQDDLPAPGSVGLVNLFGGGQFYPAAYVFVHLTQENRVARFISKPYREYIDEEVPIDIP